MRKITAFILAAAMLSLCACGQNNDQESSSSSSEASSSEVTSETEEATEEVTEEVTEEATEEETEDNGENAPEEYLQPDESQLNGSEESSAETTEAPKLPDNAQQLVEAQLETFRDKDFNKWKEAIGSASFDTFCDMIKDQAPEDMDPDFPMTQLKSGFDFITGTMPEGFADIDSFTGRVENIQLIDAVDDEQIYSFSIADTDMTGEFGVYHYNGNEFIVLNNVYGPEG